VRRILAGLLIGLGAGAVIGLNTGSPGRIRRTT
jgi:hypothetical protein